MTNSNVKRNNPLVFDSYQAQTLESAYNLLMSALYDYAESKNLPPREVEEIKQLFQNAYAKKKAAYFLHSKLRQFETRLDKAIGLVLEQSFLAKQDLNNGSHFPKRINHFDNYEPF